MSFLTAKIEATAFIRMLKSIPSTWAGLSNNCYLADMKNSN
jgi:hypothetical protein